MSTDCNPGTWNNWATTLTADPKCIFYPESEQDLIDIVAHAKTNGVGKIRCADSGHSWSPGAVTDQYLVVCTKMTGCEVETTTDPKTGETVYLLHVEPGVTQGAAARFAQKHSPSLCFPTLGVDPSITLGGFVANGCHGTGWNQPTFSDLVQALRLVTVDADGNPKVVTLGAGDADLAAARVSLGALGILSRITLKLVPMFAVERVDETKPMSALVARDDSSVLQKTVTQYDYVELFWFPFNTDVWYKHYQATAQTPTNDPLENVWDAIVQWLSTGLGSLVLEELSKHPEYTPPVMQALFKFAPTHDSQVQWVTDAFLYQKDYFKVVDMSFAIPIENGSDFAKASQAWYQVVDGVCQHGKEGDYPVNVTLHARFIKNSQALLSPAFEASGSATHYCFIEFLSFQPQPASSSLGQERLKDYVAFVKEIGAEWIQLGGRPHWAKLFQDIPGVFPYVYQAFGGADPSGNLAQFDAVRTKYDPNGVFLNAFVEQILTGKS